MFEHSRRQHQIAGIGIVAILACSSSQAEPLSESVSLSAPPGTRMLVAPEVSEDGRTLAFTIFAEEWKGSVHVTSLAELSTEPLRGGKFVWSSGGFSPDGRFLLVSQLDPPKMLMRIPVEGGEGIPIAASGNVGADWGPDNNIVIGSEKSGLRLVPAGGGSTKVLTSLKEGEIGHWFPKFIPGGHAVLFYAFTGDRTTGQVGLYDFSSGKRRTLLRGTKAMCSSSGHLLFWRDGSLWAVRFDPVRLAVSGDPVVVIQGLGADPNGDAWYSMSREGTLVYIMEDSWRAIGEAKPELIVSNNWIEALTRALPSP